MGRQVLRGEEKAVTELPRLEAWMGQQVSLYPREGSPRGRTIGLLRNVDERGVMLEEPGGIVSFYPWTVIFTIRVGEPEEEPAAVELGEQPEEQPREQWPRYRSIPDRGGWGGWYAPG
jgi:hypothetical protein